MDIASLTGANNGASVENNSKAFRDADFMAIMLAEISNQDPMNPTETSKLVENMQKLQELATSRFEKYREDLQWAQSVAGQTVTVTQANVSESEAKQLADRGIIADRGYGYVTGKVENYKLVGESVWLTVDGKDYPIDNVQRLEPKGFDATDMIAATNPLLGRLVQYVKTVDNQPGGAGRVTDASWTEDGRITLTVGGKFVDFNDIRAIGE